MFKVLNIWIVNNIKATSTASAATGKALATEATTTTTATVATSEATAGETTTLIKVIFWRETDW
jgi:hypothetical protein